MALIILCSLLVYLAVILVGWVFALGGTIGILAKSILHEITKFSLKTFFAEGRRLFVPLSLFSSVIGIMFLLIAFFLGILVGAASTIIDIAKSYEATFGLFISFFCSLVLMSVGIALILLTLSIATYGVACLVFEKPRSVQAIKETVKYLYYKTRCYRLLQSCNAGIYGNRIYRYSVGGPPDFCSCYRTAAFAPCQLLIIYFMGI